MLVDKIICVLLLTVIVRAQNAPQAPARNPRTIQTFLTSVGDLFGYDVFRRPRIVINLPAALPAGPPPAAPAPPPAPAPAPPAPAPAPAAPPPAPAPAPPAAPSLVAAPNLLTDSVRRQFSVNLNWDRNRSPQNEPIISAVVVSPAGVTLPAANTQIPVAAPAAPISAPPPPPPPSPRQRVQRLPDYDEQSEREEEDDDRPKRFYIDIPDYGNAEEVKESKREISEDKDQSKVRFKEDFQNYWKNAPWIDERGYKYIVPQEAAASTLIKANRPNDIPQELSKYEEISLPKENKVRSLKIRHNVRVYGQDSFAAPSTAITYFQKPPQDKQTAQPSYLTSKVVNAELLKFYKQKFKNDAANQQEQQFNQPIYVSDYVEQPQNEEQLNNDAEKEQVHDQPVNDYVQNAPLNDEDANSPLNFYSLPGNQNKQVKFQQIIIENETPLDFYANPQLPLQDFRIDIKDDETENIQKDESPAEEVRIQPASINNEEANIQNSNADDIESINDEKIMGSNDKENFEVEHLSDNVGDKEEHATNTDETKAEEDQQQKEEVKEADETNEQPSQAVDQEDDYNYNFNLDSFVKTHFGDRKPKTFEEVREEIEAEREFREQQIREKEEELEKEKQLANDHEDTNENEEENEEQSEATKEKGNEDNDETKKVETQKEEEVERENTETDKNNEEEKPEQEVEASGKDETETSAKDEEDEKQKITELERQHEKDFYVIFPKLGEGTEYENFFKTFEPDDESKAEKTKINENENIDKDETNHDGEKSESTKTVKKYKQTENKKPIKSNKNLKKDSLKDFDINEGYKKAKENFSKILLAPNKHKYPKEKAKSHVKFEPKTKFKDKNNFESTERSIVQPLYSGVWSAGNLQELYKQNKPVSIPFDHDYSASERNQKLKTRPKRETDEYLKDDPEEIQINPDEYVFDNTKIINQLSEHPAEYVPEAYSEDFTYEVPEPKFPDVKHLEKKNFKEDHKFSPNAKIISKQLARKTSYISVDKPKTVAT